MELKNDHEEQKSFSILEGDEFHISRILAREALKGQSSRIFYRSAKGVPFKWETNPGIPKIPQEDQFFPLSPSPLMQSIGLPLPNVDDRDHETNESDLKKAIISSLRKMVKKNIISDIRKKVEILGSWSSKQQESSRFGDSNGEFVGSVKGSSFSSNSLFSKFSSNGRVVDTSTVDGPFYCNPLDVHTILDEGITKIYYCSHHKAAFEVEEDKSCHSRILSKGSASDPFSGPLDNEQTPGRIPFQWEMQPGTPKFPPENDLIPPPSPPPAAQSFALPWPRQHDGGQTAKEYSVWKRAWFRRRERMETGNVKNGISYTCHENVEVCGCGEEFEASLRRSASFSSLSSVVSKSKGLWGVCGSYSSCSPWSKRYVLLVARRKFKSFIS